MKKTILSIVAMLAFATSSLSAQVQDFFDAGLPEKLFTFGVRAGVNTSNLSDNRSSAISDLKLARNQWKAGFTIGAVADINIRNFLVLQPGFFIQTRNHDYSYTMVGEGRDYWGNIEGNRSSSYIQIPILASLRKDFTEELQVQVDFGPYFMYGIGGEDEQKCFEANFGGAEGEKFNSYYHEDDYFGDDGTVKGYDWGFKMGAGVVIMKHYYVGIHYEAGCRNVLKTPDGSKHEYSGRNKAWNFTVGYNF